MQISEPAEYVLLGLLHERPMHGYELFQQFESGTLGQIVHLEMSQLYAFLKKLERLGYIAAHVETQGLRPPRKIFHLTEAGHDIFFAWLPQPVEKPRDIRILFLIKLYFTQRLQPHSLSVLVEQQRQACQRFLTNLETKHYSGLPQEEESFLDHVVLRSRIHQTRSLLDWLSELQAELATTV
jgi:DNA-binding PadR family transcriptional regulator